MEIPNNREAARLEAVVDGRRCVCQYRMYRGVMMFTHTGVAAALDHVRARGLKGRPDCSDAQTQRHRETQDLLPE